MSLPYRIVTHEGAETIAVYTGGDFNLISSASHPLYRHIRDGLVRGTLSDEEIISMVTSAADTLRSTIVEISDKVTFDQDSRSLMFDGEPLDNVLSRHIVRLLTHQGVAAATPWARFMEKLSQNPSRLSRLHLYAWLDAVGDFTITSRGDILAYKAVGKDRLSFTSGKEDVSVNGTIYRGRIPNPDGAVVEMDRSLVDDDRNRACSVGLHVGTFDFASAFGGSGSTILLVQISPADVVSVPRDNGSAKVRACRYEVLTEIRREVPAHQHVLDTDNLDEDAWDEYEYDDWGW